MCSTFNVVKNGLFLKRVELNLNCKEKELQQLVSWLVILIMIWVG